MPSSSISSLSRVVPGVGPGVSDSAVRQDLARRGFPTPQPVTPAPASATDQATVDDRDLPRPGPPLDVYGRDGRFGR